MALTKNLIKEILLAAHPVGSYYISDQATSPANLFGGTWERVENVVLFGASSRHPAGETGGAEKVELTADQNGNHYHEYSYTYNGVTHSAAPCGDRSMNGTWGSKIETVDGYHIGAIDQHSSGKGEAHENMMPYISAYIWRRTA